MSETRRGRQSLESYRLGQEQPGHRGKPINGMVEVSVFAHNVKGFDVRPATQIQRAETDKMAANKRSGPIADKAHTTKVSSRPAFDDVPATRRRNLSAVRGKDTAPELLVRRGLHALGYRFRLHDKRLPGRPDIVLSARRTVIEVRGCFWHRHGCSNSVLPRTRAEWWEQKLARNVARNAANAAALEAAGWRLLVVWECEIRSDLPGALGRLRTLLGPPGRA